MKGFIALSLAALPLALAAGVKRPVQIAISYDEELGCTGGPPLVAALREGLPAAAAAIVGEPSRMRVVTGHKGGAGWNVRVRGKEVHSSLLPEGVSAVMEAARFLAWVNERNDALQALPKSASGFAPPFTTLHAGQIGGGTAHNITAADCWFNLEVRSLPEESLSDWVATIEGVGERLSAALDLRVAGTGIDMQRYFDVPALVPETGGAAEALARRLTGDNGQHVVSYGTEAGHFQHGGYSCVVCGPGDIAQAHQADEYLEVAEFAAGWRFMERMVAELAA